MKKNLTELVFILDRSGSMSGLESDTIGGYNSFLEKQKEEDGSCLVSTVLFNQHSNVIPGKEQFSLLSHQRKLCCGGARINTEEAVAPIGLQFGFRHHRLDRCDGRRHPSHQKCPQIHPQRGCTGKYDLCHHHRRAGECVT